MSNLRADVLKLAKGNVYQEHERFIRTFDKKWRSDENIILIMCAITLFSPDRPKTVHSDVIKLEQVGWNNWLSSKQFYNIIYCSTAELVLLPAAAIPGEHLPGLRGAVHLSEADAEDLRAAPTQRRDHQRVPGREPGSDRAAAEGNFRPKSALSARQPRASST